MSPFEKHRVETIFHEIHKPKLVKLVILEKLTTVHTVKSKVKILQNIMAFSEYMNITKKMLEDLKMFSLHSMNSRHTIKAMENEDWNMRTKEKSSH